MTVALVAAQTWIVLLDAAPWLLIGLMAAGLAHGWLPADRLGRWLGGRGVRPAVMAALIGAPLPLCSCAVLPAAVGLRRSGASREAVTAFLIATPETGLDSVLLSYGLLGPFFAIARPVAAVVSAVATGLAMMLLPPEAAPVPAPTSVPAVAGSECGGGACHCDTQSQAGVAKTPWRRTLYGLEFAFTTLFDELAPWLALGLLAAAVTATVMPPQALGQWGGGLPAMLAMIAIGVPMYICASASTPLAAALLLAGVSPGAVMVFLLVGPATNLATIMVVRREMGSAASAIYLGGLILCGLVAGLLTDLAAPYFFDIARLPVATAEDGAAGWPELVAAVILLGLGGRSLWLRLKAAGAGLRPVSR